MTNKASFYKLEESLKGKILIAPPTMLDNRFLNSLVLITSHDANGAIGIVMNKQSAHQFKHIVANIDKNIAPENINIGDRSINIVLGGPMHPNSIFILHSTDYKEDSSILINENLYMTNKPDLIIKLANNQGPKHSLISIGCSTWAPQQLEKEMENYGWLITEYSSELFHNNSDSLYLDAMQSIGINNPNYALFINKVQK